MEDAPMAWRYSVVGRDFAYSLTICKSSGRFTLHRAFGEFLQSVHDCDLMARALCDEHTDASRSAMPPTAVMLDEGLMFWSTYAVQGRREQPTKFWRALEKRANQVARVARSESYRTTRCPRCNGTGAIELKRKSQEKVKVK
jgi:hypothetical protein